MNSPHEAGQRRRLAYWQRELKKVDAAVALAEANMLESARARGASESDLIHLREMFQRVAVTTPHGLTTAPPAIKG